MFLSSLDFDLDQDNDQDAVNAGPDANEDDAGDNNAIVTQAGNQTITQTAVNSANTTIAPAFVVVI